MDGKDLSKDNDIRHLADIERRLQSFEVYVRDVRFLLNKLKAVSRQVGPLQRTVDSAYQMVRAIDEAEKKFKPDGDSVVVRAAVEERDEFSRQFELLLQVPGISLEIGL